MPIQSTYIKKKKFPTGYMHARRTGDQEFRNAGKVRDFVMYCCFLWKRATRDHDGDVVMNDVSQECEDRRKGR